VPLSLHYIEIVQTHRNVIDQRLPGFSMRDSLFANLHNIGIAEAFQS
jgi:hypothetical protein